MRTLLRLTVKQRRFEVGGYLAIVVGLAVATAGLAFSIGALHLENCVDPDTGATTACRAAESQWVALRAPATLLSYSAAVLSVLVSALVGVTLVAGEIERRTAFLPWTIGTSRRRWLFERVLVLAACVGIPAVFLGLAGDALQQATFPTVPVGASLADYEVRGWLIPARALIGLSAGTLAGTLTGRSLPALLVSMAMVAAGVGAVVTVSRQITLTNTTEVNDPGAIITDFRYRDGSGNLLTFDQATLQVPIDDPHFAGVFTLVDFGIAGTRSPFVVGSEVALTTVLSIGGVIVAAGFVDRRRPY